MFSFLVIFIFILVWIFILVQLVDQIFIINKKIKAQASSLTFISISLALSFVVSMISFYLVLNFLFELPTYLGLETKQQDFEALISQQDCLPLTNAIQQTESQIGQQENHRYLEETAHLFTLKLEYQKAADKFQEQVKIYKNLELSAEAQKYAQQISTRLEEQSKLFTQRKTITTNKEGIKKVYKLLDKMDKLEQERLRLIEQVKQQCNNTA